VATTGGSGYGPYQTGQGGEFTLQVSDDLKWIVDNSYVEGLTKNVVGITNSFQTFCLEHSEYIYPNTTFDVAFSDRAKDGGPGAPAGGDPISIGTAWLYSQFAMGTLSGYAYNKADGGTSAAKLQNAIWWLESEGGIGYSATNPFMKAVKDTFGESGSKADAAPGAYGVGVLNMYSSEGGLRQDQLVMVPEPSTLLSLGFCLVGVALVVKKFKVQA
jgi:hypothetical protein